ncbi:Basic-leucine zipper [Gracilaria domingensis]|nr:Basic-leucine zipper [Gracilaria domingensis]
MPGKGARRGAVVRRVLKPMAKRNSDVPAVLSRIREEQAKQDSVNERPELESEEKRGKKRKIEDAESEEELKKLRRVRNRESVEKCRAKQRMRLEKLEEEDKALRSECQLMLQMAEAFQEKWKQVAEEYQKIGGKEAVECPIAIPLDMKLPEVATLYSGD